MLTEWLAVLKNLLGIPEDDTSKDELISFLAALVLQQIQLATGRNFLPGVYRDYLNGPNRLVYLTEFPVFDIASMTYQGGGEIPETDYVLNKTNGRIHFLANSCHCADFGDCCRGRLVVEYQANTALPPPWVSMAAADAIRAAMAQTESGNTYGFGAKKIAVTDVGSVELSTMGDTPSTTLTASVNASIAPYLDLSYGSSYSCCSGPQISEFVSEVPAP